MACYVSIDAKLQVGAAAGRTRLETGAKPAEFSSVSTIKGLRVEVFRSTCSSLWFWTNLLLQLCNTSFSPLSLIGLVQLQADKLLHALPVLHLGGAVGVILTWWVVGPFRLAHLLVHLGQTQPEDPRQKTGSHRQTQTWSRSGEWLLIGTS